MVIALLQIGRRLVFRVSTYLWQLLFSPQIGSQKHFEIISEEDIFMKYMEILLLAGVCFVEAVQIFAVVGAFACLVGAVVSEESIVGAVLIFAVVGAFACLVGAVSEEISHKGLAVLFSLVITAAGILASCGVAWGINEVLGVIENWDREKGIGLLSDAEESELIADVREKGSKFIVVDEDGEMHEYHVLAEDDRTSDAQENSDDTAVRYYTDDVKITKTSW